MALRLSLAPDTITTQRPIHLHQDNPVTTEELYSTNDQILTGFHSQSQDLALLQFLPEGDIWQI